MTVDDCFDLGTVAYRGYHFTRSREWLQEGVRLTKEKHPEDRAKLKSLLEYLAWVEYLVSPHTCNQLRSEPKILNVKSKS